MHVALVVDDEPMVLRLMVRILAEAGFQVHDAPNAVQAIEVACLLPSPPDVLVTDLRMKPVDGADLARLAVGRWPGIRVLYVSGFDGEHLTVPGVLLKKPFSAENLVTAVRGVLGLDRISSSSA
jgi:CheY-like chemotaxis protein